MKQRAAARFSFQRRAAGLLLHPTSLPGPHGCGDLGPEAFAFVDFLAAAGLMWWQMLPVNPPGPGGSPYSALSAFAGSPLLVSLARLAEEGLLRGADLPAASFRRDEVDYAAAARFRTACLRRAWEVFGARRGADDRLAQFRAEQEHWLADWTLFAALRRAQRGRAWYDWPAELRLRRTAALRRAERELAGEIGYETFVQYQFRRQWEALRAYCRRRGVGLIGDIPIFVGYDSADVWAHRRLFTLDARGRLKLKSGVPPDNFSRDGQLWNHPLYEWKRHAAEGFAWWIERFRAAFAQVDAVRIDHFLGFDRCWAVPGGAATARRGRWLRSPGDALFTAVRRALGRVEIIAEDLGLLTESAAALRDRHGFPGMRLLHWGFGEGAYHLPHSYVRNCVVYPGTHDNNTTVGWYRELPAAAAERVRRYTGGDGREVHWDLIRLALGSVANTAIVAVQDVLGLDATARMNYPSKARGNWKWRLVEGQLGAAQAARLRGLAEVFGRMANRE